MPLHDLRKKIEEVLVKIGFKREVANDCSTSFYRAEEHSKSPNKTPGQPDEIKQNLNIDLAVNGTVTKRSSKAQSRQKSAETPKKQETKEIVLTQAERDSITAKI